VAVRSRVPQGTISQTSAQRFAAKVRSRRRRRMLAGTGVVTVLVVAVWAALWSSWSTVETVQVTGTQRVDADVVRAAGEREAGQPLLLARVDQVRAEVSRQRLVRSVRVTRHWPSVLRIDVVEREPVAAVPVDAGSTNNSIGKVSHATDPAPGAKSPGTKAPGTKAAGATSAPMRLVDVDGVTITTTTRVPRGMPILNVDPSTSRGVRALRACLEVLSGLPGPIRTQVRAVGAVSPDGIWLRLTSGARVQWGGADQGALKASVLTALLKQKAVEYDLRAPQNPAVRQK
jgi:cell division protein FtsQ